MAARSQSRVGRWLWIAAGGLSLGFAGIGAVLPLIPAVPFLLVAAACFARGSPRLHRWIRSHPWFGSSIRAWERHRAVPRRTKIYAIVLLWLTIPVSIWLLDPLWVRGLLAAVLIAASVFLARIPTLPSRASP